MAEDSTARIADSRILIVVKKNAHRRTRQLASELAAIIPNTILCAEEVQPLSGRGMAGSTGGQNIQDAARANHSQASTEGAVIVSFAEDIGPQFVIFKTDRYQIVFKLIEFKSRDDMKIPDSIKRENSQLVLSNFSTDIGATVAEFLMELFPVGLESNQVVNFSVHKDFLFFRMYRFCIRAKGPVMEPIGPHLTLRLWRMTEYHQSEGAEGEKKTHNFNKYVKNRNLL